MYVRLAFAVAAHLDPDILLIDEVLAVGDLAFQRKCMEHASAAAQTARVRSSWSRTTCSPSRRPASRTIYLSRGRVVFDGPTEAAIQLYEKESRLDTVPWAQGRLGDDPSNRPIHITDLEVVDESGRPRTYFDHGERMRIRIHFHANQPLHSPTSSSASSAPITSAAATIARRWTGSRSAPSRALASSKSGPRR